MLGPWRGRQRPHAMNAESTAHPACLLPMLLLALWMILQSL